MGHVDHEQRVDGIGDLAEPREVELAGIGRPAGDDELGPALVRDGLDGVHVDLARLAGDLVRRDVVQAPGHVDLHAVAQVAAVGQREAHDRVAGLQERIRTGIRVEPSEHGSTARVGRIF